MIVKFMDYEQITPDLVEKLRSEFACSKEYVEGIFAKRSAKEWAESCAGLCALYDALVEAGLNVKDVEVTRLPSGKPVFVNVNMYFNISHSCGRAVCVLSDRPVGVDIEFLKKVRNFDLIAKSFFSRGEQEKYRSAKNQSEEFYRIWTRNEALIKSGSGEIGYDELCKINTYEYADATFSEIKKGGYIISICEA